MDRKAVIVEESRDFTSRVAVTAVMLALTYLCTALMGLNRLVWLGSHQGNLYWPYWAAFFAVSIILLVWGWPILTTSIRYASAVGMTIGYVASCLAGRLMYFDRGFEGPLTTVRHEIVTFGISHAVMTVLLNAAMTGGFLYGLLAALLIYAYRRKRFGLIVGIVTLTATVSIAMIIFAPADMHFKHVHLLR